MKNKNYRQSALLSMIILFFGFFAVRYALLGLHNMKDWPRVLFVFCFIVLVICFFMKKTVMPLITSISYSIGFAAGYVLQTNGVYGGGRTNNLWLIWTIVILAAVVLSIMIELLASRNSKNESA